MAKDKICRSIASDPLIWDADEVAPGASVQDYDGHQYLVVTFRRLKEVMNLNYVLQESEDLSAWESCDPDSRLVSPPVDLGNGMESVTVRWKLPLDGPESARQGFMRIGVEPRRQRPRAQGRYYPASAEN